jgi:hypothetical protein
MDDSPPLFPRPTRQSDLWPIDPSVPGHWCAWSISDLGFWRSEKSSETEVTIAALGKRITVPWPAGSSELAWPEEVPLKEGYSASVQLDRSTPKQFFVHQLDAHGSMHELANQLAERKCYHQLGILLGPAGGAPVQVP